MEIIIPTLRVTFSKEQLHDWINGDREYCKDSYCRNLTGSKGFCEYVAGKFYESLDYQWIHHDFNLLGGNKPGKFQKPKRYYANTSEM